ncbi:MAG: pyridoxine 5'-phosphate oxidase C-terminal domain-containing protein [Gammaproteobacteria bacterium]
MITFIDLCEKEPYEVFKKLYVKAQNAGQKAIEAVAVSNFNDAERMVDSRFVNLKYIKNNEWIFFSNYNSPKSKALIEPNNRVSVLVYWQSINVQVRIKANIFKTNEKFSDQHFLSRDKHKNALAISSDQSRKVDSFSNIKSKFDDTLKQKSLLMTRPSYWGGFSFIPFYFEFWEGQEFRLNKREVYEEINGDWIKYTLQP